MPLKISELHEYALMTLAARKKQYLQTPANIVEHFNNELENVNSYNGRQLLEMLQNADDAASKPGIKKKALIRLIGDELTIANNGHAFTVGGLESILYSNLSPKVMEQNMIGQKGLGFRSVLSWSQEVTILSDGISLKFSQKIAKEFLEDMLKVKPSIRKYLATKTKEKDPIAVLRVPCISTLDSDLKGSYDTFVIIKLKPDVIKKVQEQINNLVDGETLIFLNHLEEIELISPERNEKIIKKTTATGVRITVINGKNNPAINWFVNEDQGTFKDKNYNLKVAWTKDLIYHSGIVHSFFKTRQTFPFPGLIHGTFELNSDRNDLIKDPDGKNEFLLGKLSELLVDTALKIASSEKKSNYKPLQLLNIETNKLTSIFVDYKFADSLIDAIKKAKVFPSVNGHYLDFSEEPVFYTEPVAQFIRGKDLDNLLLHTTEGSLISLLDKITYYRFAPITYSKIINKRIGGDPKMLSVLIRSFIRSNKTDLQNMNGDFGSLFPIFRDEAGKAIPWTKKMFLPTPFSGEKLPLPEEIELAFLDSRLSDELLTHFGINDYIYLDTRLAPFHFHRFSLEVFAAILKEVYLTTPTAGNVGLFHQNLYLLKKRSQERGENPLSQPSYAELPAINKAGNISKISSLFIGANFGDNNLAQELFEKVPEKLLADPRTFGLKRSQSLKEYFYWLGAKAKPAKVNLIIDRKHKDYTAYKEFFLSKLRYPEKIGAQVYTYKSHASQALDGFQIQSFEDIDYILKNVKHEIIF